MFSQVIAQVRRVVQSGLQLIQQRISVSTKPNRVTVAVGAVADMVRTKPELIAENALLRQQLIVLQRSVKRPKLTVGDRWLVVLLASRLRQWKQALLIILPDTVLRWHRDWFSWLWRRKSRARSSRKPILDSTVALIQQMLRENQLWGAERVRGELLKSGLRVSKRTIQRYKRVVRPAPTGRQTWRTFVHNHGQEIWACDFLQVQDLLFRNLFCFFLVELGSRKVIHVSVTRHPTDQWVAQQLRDVTPFGTGPKYVIRDNDSKYGAVFDRAAMGVGIEVLRTPYHAPRANAIVERFLGSVRRECLDHLLLFGDQHLARVVKAYVRYFNDARPHQGISQQVPAAAMTPLSPPPPDAKVISIPVLGGLHHAYRWTA